jgi:DHA2 family multidrug resistance protein
MPGSSLDVQAAPALDRRVNPWAVAMALIVSSFMEVLATTVVNVALPHIARSLSVSAEEASWSLTSYLVANALILPVINWLAIYFGRRRLVIVAVLTFTTASLFCGLAPSLPVLIIFRLIQGASGGALQPLSQAVLLDAFPPEKRGLAMAFWGLGIVIAPVLGPVVGGWLTDNYSWRWTFYINIPAGVISVLLTRLYVFDPPYLPKIGAAFKGWGLGLLVVGVCALQVVLDSGEKAGWFSSNRIRILAVIAAAGLTMFVFHELRNRNPMLNLRVFQNRTYAAGVVLTTAIGFVLYGSLFVLPAFLEMRLGYSATSAGLAMAPRGLGSLVVVPVIGMLSSRVDPRKLLAAGLLGTAWAQYALSHLNVGTSPWAVFWPQFAQGASLALVIVPLSTLAFGVIPNKDVGNASAIFNLMRNIGGSVGIACTATFFFRRQQLYTGMLGARASIDNSAVAANISQPIVALHHSYATLWGVVQRQAAVYSFRDTCVGMAIILLLIVPLLLAMKRPARFDREENS